MSPGTSLSGILVVMAGADTVEEAYRAWAGELTRYATALVGPADAADVVAEAFATALARGPDAWRTVTDHRGYLYRSVLNAARMRHRGALRRRNRELRWLDEPTAGELIADPAVRAALDRLSVQQRAVTFLTYWLDLTPSTIAGMLGVSEGAIKRQLARARAQLREVLT